MKNKNLILAAVALLLLVGILLGVFFATRPDTQEGAKTFTFIVVHKGGSEKTFTYHTDAEYLGDALLAEGIIVGQDGPYGLDVSHVDGEKAVWAEDHAYWALYVGEEYATTGVSTTPVYDGSAFKYVYTPAE